MKQALLLLGLALGARQLATPPVAAREVLRSSVLGTVAPGAAGGRVLWAASPAMVQSTVHRAVSTNVQVACGRANTAASERAKRLGTCVIKLATPQSYKFSTGLYTAEAVSADAKYYPAHTNHKPPVPLEQ